MIQPIIFFVVTIYLLVASIIDIKKNEVPDWLSFSLFFITWSFVFLEFSLTKNLNFLLISAFSYVVFFILANILYYTGTFGGGDYKLLIAISPAIFWPLNFFLNFLIITSIYGLAFAFFIFSKNIKKFRLKKEIDASFLIISLICLLFFIFSLFTFSKFFSKFFYFAFLFLIFPLLFLVVRFSDKSCITEVTTKEITPGDVIVEKIKVGNITISPKVGGLSEEEIKLLKKSKIKKIKIKKGIPFVPVFFFTYFFSYTNFIFAMVSFPL